MVECIFVKVSLGADENVLEESPQMFAELDDVENLHRGVRLLESDYVSGYVCAVPVPTQPCGHKSRRQDDHKSGY